MNIYRQKGLADVIRNMIIGVQKSKQINEKMSIWHENVIKMNNKEIVKCSEVISFKVCEWAEEIETKNKKGLTFTQVNKKITEELGSYNGKK